MRFIKINDDLTIDADQILGVKVSHTGDRWNWYVVALLPFGGTLGLVECNSRSPEDNEAKARAMAAQIVVRLEGDPPPAPIVSDPEWLDTVTGTGELPRKR